MKENFHSIINLTNLAKSTITIPPHKIPKDFSLNNKDYFCGGYFIGYNCSYSKEDLVSIFKRAQFTKLTKKSADFLILFVNNRTQEIFVLTGNSGRFPCYFRITNNCLFLSTNFVWVSKQVKKTTLNLNFVLDYIFNNNTSSLTEQTLFQEVYQIPPGTLLSVKKNQGFILTPVGEIHPIINDDEKLSIPLFIETLIALLEQILEENLYAIGASPYVSELTSGLDSSLVSAIIARILRKKRGDNLTSISYVSSLDPNNNNEAITRQFAKLHNINVAFLNIDSIFPFSTSLGYQVIQQYFYPANHTTDFIKTRYEIDNRIIFEGHGGDELCDGGRGLAWRFPLQMEYFNTISQIPYGYNQMFTETAIDFLLDQQRFSNRNLYAHILPASTINIGLQQFPLYWETDTWGISPLSDYRIMRLAAYLPKNVTKKEIWKSRNDIFLKEQLFLKKAPFDNHINQYLQNLQVKKFVISLLENSRLNQLGIIRGSYIIDLLRTNNDDLLSEPILLNVIILEYFIQNNLSMNINYS